MSDPPEGSHSNNDCPGADEPPAGPAWFCVRTQCKREHIAAAWLHANLGVKTYVPRIRFQRSQKRGLVWFNEALFPNYLFARFDLALLVQEIDCAPGVRGLVRFGKHCPAISDSIIDELRARIGPDDLHTLDGLLCPGETVRLRAGVFNGLTAVVERLLSAGDRVLVLLDFLGRQSMVEVNAANVAPIGDVRGRMFIGGNNS